MDILEAISARHSVRKYIDRQISADVQAQLRAEIAACNAQGDLNIQLATDEPEAFHGLMARYGKFVNVNNYLALVGKKSKTLDESLGYFGERIVLKATTLGLDSCWVALTYQKGKCACTIAPGETLRCVIALGYGRDHGVPHRSKPMEALCKADGSIPEWFRCGMQAALLAPTATNQQKFMFTLSGSQVHAQATGGFYPQIDLGIVKYHFELGAGAGNFKWA
ncbi:MAG TPA: nitroreductase family protein [Anaerolineaceae bacterium]|nr:nitroreductase family protein [Anaerolineaceae bacterium]